MGDLIIINPFILEPMKFSKFFKFWFPVILYSGMIFRVSAIPNLHAPLEKFDADKLWHLGKYVLLGSLVARAIRNTKIDLPNTFILYSAFLFVSFYAASDEFHQFFVAGRTADWKDWLADIVGGSLGTWIYLKVNEYCPKLFQHREI